MLHLIFKEWFIDMRISELRRTGCRKGAAAILESGSWNEVIGKNRQRRVRLCQYIGLLFLKIHTLLLSRAVHGLSLVEWWRRHLEAWDCSGTDRVLGVLLRNLSARGALGCQIRDPHLIRSNFGPTQGLGYLVIVWVCFCSLEISLIARWNGGCLETPPRR